MRVRDRFGHPPGGAAVIAGSLVRPRSPWNVHLPHHQTFFAHGQWGKNSLKLGYALVSEPA